MKTVLKRPLITEKYNEIAEKLNQFAFMVDKKATKQDIKDAIEKVYDVQVDQVRTMVYQGKTKTRYTKRGFVEGRKPGFKKAIVTLKDGGIIDFYSNI